MGSEVIETTTPARSAESLAARRRQLAATLKHWLSEEGDYDQRVWPAVEQSLSNDGVHLREPDATGA